MKLKLSLVVVALAVGVAAFVAVAAPTAQAKAGGSYAVSANGTTETTGLPVFGTFTISRFKVVNGVVTAVGSFTGSVNGAEPVTTPAPLERVADVPIYFADTLVRRAMSLQQTADARPPKARMHRSLLDKLGLRERFGVNGRQKVMAGFSLDRSTAKVRRLLAGAEEKSTGAARALPVFSEEVSRS